MDLLHRRLVSMVIILWIPLLYWAYNNNIIIRRSVILTESGVRDEVPNHSEVKYVLLFAYMRGGSSFFGETILSNPNAFYFYEPDWDVYAAMVGAQTMMFPLHTTFYQNDTFRDLNDWERNYLITELKKMFTCDFSTMYTESLINGWTMNKGANGTYADCLRQAGVINKAEMVCQTRLRQLCSRFIHLAQEAKCDLYLESAHGNYNRTEGLEAFPPVQHYMQCMARLRKVVDECLPVRTKPCEGSHIRAAKILRMRMRYMEDIIKVLPNTKIIHQLRDPRGTVTSRRHSARLLYKDIAREARLLCRKMADDIRERHILEEKYPGVFLQTRYEDLADRPLDLLQQIYNHIGEKIPEAVLNHMTTITQANHIEEGSFATSRSNSSATARAWLSSLSRQEKSKLDEACRDYFEIMGYEQ